MITLDSSRRAIVPLLVAAALAGGCATTHDGFRELRTEGTGDASSADVTVWVAGRKDHTAVDLEIRYLPPPERVSAGARVYVVWAVPAGGPPLKAGALAYNEEDREATGGFTTDLRAMELRVTAEAVHTVAEPRGPVILVYQVRAGN